MVLQKPLNRGWKEREEWLSQQLALFQIYRPRIGASDEKAPDRMPRVLLIHGAADRGIPVSDAQQFQKLCAMRGLSYEMKVFAGETHVFSPAASADAHQRIEIFLEDALPIRP